MTNENIARECDLDISGKTVTRRLKEAGLNRRLTAQKEKLNESHIQNRLNFTQNYSNLTINDWKKFVFTGKMKISFIKILFN
jgi:hypothetical protein